MCHGFYISTFLASHFSRSQLDSHIYVCIQSVGKAPILYLWKTPVCNHERMGVKKANNVLGLIINSFDLIGSLKGYYVTSWFPGSDFEKGCLKTYLLY